MGKPLHVLLVEDSAEDALLISRHLRRGGYEPRITRVETAAAMKECLTSDAEQWNVVLADYNLPTFSAPEALRILKEMRLDIPFIMMSGAISEETAVAAMRAGAHDYVSKQNLTRLVPAIERELAEAQARSQRRAAERALELAEERFHRLVEGMPLGVLISGGDRNIFYANDAVSRLLGYTREQFASGNISLDRIFVSPAGQPQPLTIAQLWTGDRSDPVEMECVSRSGARIPVLVGATVLNAEGSASALQIAAFIVDLTEQKKSEKVLRRTEKLAAAGRLAASIAHEINNPLEAVTNCLYLLDQGQIDANSREYLKLAQQELNRVSHITTQTLRFYRQNTRPVKTDVHELMENVLALYEGRLRSLRVTVERDLGEVPIIVAYDGAVRQVLANLIGNSVDAMQVSGGRLIVRTRSARDWQTSRCGISMTVADSGTGMSQETLTRIFEPFFSTKGNTGTGLGLWVSRDIVAKHRGFIRVRSRQQGKSGTVFRIFLPIQPAEVLERENFFLRATA